MTVQVRKFVALVEDVLTEGGRAVAGGRRRAVVGAVVANPYAGGYDEELAALVDAGAELGHELMQRCLALLDGRAVEAYGKAGIVGVAGELEHASAVLHPKFGAPVRELVEGRSILPSAKKRGAAGTAIDVPLHHTRAMLVRSHFDAIEFRIGDAPLPDELVIALGVSDGGRPHARVGGLRAEDVEGVDGVR